MHYLETHAQNCGAKIDKPFIYTSFFPLPLDKYITFHSDTQGTAKNYDYLQDVINIITPALGKQGILIASTSREQLTQIRQLTSFRILCFTLVLMVSLFTSQQVSIFHWLPSMSTILQSARSRILVLLKNRSS